MEIARLHVIYISGLSDAEKKAKQAVVFDQAISEIAKVHWKDASFDAFPVIPVPVKSKCNQSNSDHDIVSQFLKAPLKQVRDDTHKMLLEEYQFLLGHVRRHHNEVIMLKCVNTKCDYCTQHPVQAIEAFSFLRERSMKIFYPLPTS